MARLLSNFGRATNVTIEVLLLIYFSSFSNSERDFEAKRPGPAVFPGQKVELIKAEA